MVINKLLISNIERPVRKLGMKNLNLSLDINRIYQDKMQAMTVAPNVCSKFLYQLKQKIVQVRDYPFLNQIGEGSCGKVYKFNAPQCYSDGFVVKSAHADDSALETIKNEAELLAQIPSAVKNSQKLIAYYKFDNKYYLVTNFIKTTAEDVVGDFSTTSIKSLASDLIQLDKAKLFHQDLAPANLRINNDDVNILDYGYATKFRPFKHEDYKAYYCRPEFCVPSNLIDFEDKTLFCYMDVKMNPFQNIRNFFKDYLKIKSENHKQRIPFLEQEFAACKESLTEKEIFNAKQAIEYEKLEAQMLENPTDEITDLEALKSQISYSNRLSDIELFGGGKEFIAYDKKLEAISYANRFKEKAQQMIEKCNDSKTNDYLSFQVQYADYWLNNLKIWSQQLIDSGAKSRDRFPYNNFEKPADRILKMGN